MTPSSALRADRRVAIVSTQLDASTDAVAAMLAARGAQVSRINTEDFPYRLSASVAFDTGEQPSVRFPNSADFDLTNADSVWFRRLRAAPRPAELNQGVHEFCMREARYALLGALLMTERGIMSPPHRIWAAEHKLFQLAYAQRVGLPVPKTVATNDPQDIIAMFRRCHGRMIVKALRTGYVDYGTEQHAIYTSRVLEEHLDHVGDARWSPAIYQELIPKTVDLRVTAVGNRLFAAAIASQTDPAAEIDWRHTSNPNLPHERATLPSELFGKIRSLLDALGLVFAALDFIKTPDGRYVFLEVNPNGQWLWLDDILELGITEAVTDWLLTPADETAGNGHPHLH